MAHERERIWFRDRSGSTYDPDMSADPDAYAALIDRLDREAD